MSAPNYTEANYARQVYFANEADAWAAHQDYAEEGHKVSPVNRAVHPETGRVEYNFLVYGLL